MAKEKRGFTQQGFAEKAAGFQGWAKQKQSGFGKKTNRASNASKYRRDYGTRMSQSLYDAYEKDRGSFEKRVSAYKVGATKEIAGYKSDYEKRRGAFEKNVKEQRGILDQAKRDIGNVPTIRDTFNQWFEGEKIKVFVAKDGKQVFKSWVPKTVARGWLAENEKYRHTQGYHYVTEAMINGSLAMQVKGKSDALGLAKDMSDKGKMWRDFVTNEEAQGAYSGQVREWTKANDDLSKAYGEFNKAQGEEQGNIDVMRRGISQATNLRDTNIGKANKGREAQMDSLRQNYEDQRAKRVEAYKGLAKTRVKGNTDE